MKRLTALMIAAVFALGTTAFAAEGNTGGKTKPVKRPAAARKVKQNDTKTTMSKKPTTKRRTRRHHARNGAKRKTTKKNTTVQTKAKSK